MIKKTPSPSSPRKGSLVPPGLKPFQFAAKQESVHEKPTSGGDSRGDVCTLVSPADMDWPRAPGHEMSASDTERRVRLQCLIAKLQSGKDVKSKDIKLAITADEWTQYEAIYHQPRVAKLPRGMPSLFREYVTALRIADFLYHRAVRSPGVKYVKRRSFWLEPRTSLYQKAEKAYERALEILEDLVDRNPGVVSLLDRPVGFGMIEGIQTLEPESMPRLITSRSQYALWNGKPKQSRRSLKFSTLLESRDKLDALCETDHRKGTGIGDAPVIPGTVDQWILVDGKWMLV